MIYFGMITSWKKVFHGHHKNDLMVFKVLIINLDRRDLKGGS